MISSERRFAPSSLHLKGAGLRQRRSHTVIVVRIFVPYGGFLMSEAHLRCLINKTHRASANVGVVIGEADVTISSQSVYRKGMRNPEWINELP
jgi:hypothetical protein